MDEDEFDPCESQTIRDVRRWRREAYEIWSKLSLEERIAESHRLAAQFGLRIVSESEMVKPVLPAQAKKAS